MKRLCAVVLVLVGTAFLMPRHLAAQFGIKGGPNLSRYAVTAVAGYEWDSHNLLGFSVGAFYALEVTPKLFVQPELFYVSYGEKESDVGESEIWYKEQLSYIHFPVLAKFKIVDGDLAPVVFAGPYLSYLLKGTGTDYLDGTPLPSFDVKPDHKKTVYGITVGAGLEKKMGKNLLILDVRYNLDLVRNDIADILEPWSSKTRVLTVMVGIGF